MLNRVVLSVLMVIIISSCLGRAQGRTDGNLWRTLSADLKGWYLRGYIEAMASCAAFATPRLNGRPESANTECRAIVGERDNKAIALVTKVNPSQLGDALNQFYNDATNRLILVPRALGVIFMRLTGASEQNVKEITEFERQLATR
jgi:hypothetical protein